MPDDVTDDLGHCHRAEVHRAEVRAEVHAEALLLSVCLSDGLLMAGWAMNILATRVLSIGTWSRRHAGSPASIAATLGRWAAHDGGATGGSATGATPSPRAPLTNFKELTFEGSPCYAEAAGVTARQA